jgi:hypothetical protein
VSIFDVTKPEQEAITEIRWATEAGSDDQAYNLVRSKSQSAVTLKKEALMELAAEDSSLCENVSEAEGLIKALQKAIDLGWFK